MDIKYQEIGICGLSCRLCPRYHTEGDSRCGGCKSESRMAAGCPFITCAIKKKQVEFCGECGESLTCDKWKKHREAGRLRDSFKCYQTLEEDIVFILENGLLRFEEAQKERDALLEVMLHEFNEGRSKSYYCIAATVLPIAGINDALHAVRREHGEADIKLKSRALHSALDKVAAQAGHTLLLRK